MKRCHPVVLLLLSCSSEAALQSVDHSERPLSVFTFSYYSVYTRFIKHPSHTHWGTDRSDAACNPVCNLIWLISAWLFYTWITAGLSYCWLHWLQLATTTSHRKYNVLLTVGGGDHSCSAKILRNRNHTGWVWTKIIKVLTKHSVFVLFLSTQKLHLTFHHVDQMKKGSACHRERAPVTLKTSYLMT